MHKWYQEDWSFLIEVLQVGQRNNAHECRIGLEPGDTFECRYETPCDFCPTTFIKMFPIMEVIRCEGVLRYLGAESDDETKFMCPDGVVMFKLKGEKISIEEQAG